MSDQTTIKQSRGISAIWTLPILAIIICGWLLYKSYTESGVTIEVYFEDANGLTPEKTQVVYMGLPVGIVKKVVPDLEKTMVKAIIQMDKSTKPYLVEDLAFWLVKPEVSADRITGLDTIFSGSYIGVQQGFSPIPATEFTALRSAPPVSKDAPGLHIQLRSKELRSIQEGSAIYFKNIRIGNVQSYELQGSESVLIDCHILPEYSHLIQKNSRFFDASGISASGSLTNLKIRMESIASLFIGGIVVSTPLENMDTTMAENGDTFTLYEDFDSSRFGLSMTLKLSSGENIVAGVTKVIYRGYEAGFVDRVTMNDDEHYSVTAHILLDPRAAMVLKEGTRFWLVSPSISISGASNLGTLISGSYITFEMGDGEFKDDFEILNSPPLPVPLRPGKTFRLASEEVSLTNGAPVLFHKIQIGEVVGSRLAKDRKSVETTIFIDDNFCDLITEKSIFVNASGITLDASLSGISLKTEPMLAILKGGVKLFNVSDVREQADSNQLFTLHSDTASAIDAHPELQEQGLYLQLIENDLDSYKAGTPILYKKIKVGRVLDYKLTDKGKILLNCMIKSEYEHLVNSSSRFYNASGIKVAVQSGKIDVESESLESILTGGIAFITPEKGHSVNDMTMFPIYSSLKKARSVDHKKISVTFKNGSGLTPGADVKFNGINLGIVDDIKLSDDRVHVVADLMIIPEFIDLFRQNTKLWLAQPTIGHKGVKNLETILFGAYVAVLPGLGELTNTYTGEEQAPNKVPVDLPGLNLILEAKQLNSVSVGSPVYYRRVKIGQVTGYDLAFDFKDVLIFINIEEKYQQIVRQNTRFWNVSGVRVEGGLFSGVAVQSQSVDAIIAGGIALATPEKEEMGPPVKSGFKFILFEKDEDDWLNWSPDIFTIEGESGILPRDHS